MYVIGNKELGKLITFFDIFMKKFEIEVVGNTYKNPELLTDVNKLIFSHL